ELSGSEGRGAVFAKPRRQEIGGGEGVRRGERVREVGFFGGGWRARRPVGDERAAKAGGGGGVGSEPGDEARREIGVGGEERFDPGEVTERGVDQFAIEAAVAGAEGAVGCNEILDTRGEVAVTVPVRL